MTAILAVKAMNAEALTRQPRVAIGGVYPLGRAAAAHAQVERGGVTGRVVLRIRDEGS